MMMNISKIGLVIDNAAKKTWGWLIGIGIGIRRMQNPSRPAGKKERKGTIKYRKL
jgi:hypothetical protein